MKNKISKFLVCVYVIAPALAFGQPIIKVGSSPNNEDGDNPQTAYAKINAKFSASQTNIVIAGGQITPTNTVLMPSAIIFADKHDVWITNGSFSMLQLGDDLIIDPGGLNNQPRVHRVLSATHIQVKQNIQPSILKTNNWWWYPAIHITDVRGTNVAFIANDGTFGVWGAANGAGNSGTFDLLDGSPNGTNNWTIQIDSTGQLVFVNNRDNTTGAPLGIAQTAQYDSLLIKPSSMLYSKFGWTNAIILNTNSSTAWPLSAPYSGACAFVMSNNDLWLLKSSMGSTSWSTTNFIK